MILRRRFSTLALVSVIASLAGAATNGCGERHRATADTPALPATAVDAALPWEGPAEVAFIATEAGIVAVDLHGRMHATVVAGDVGWCVADPRGRVLWFARPEAGAPGDAPTHGIYVRDLTAAEAEPVRVMVGGVEGLAFDYGDEIVGLPAPHQYTVEPVLVLDGAPRLEARIGCDGDMGWLCWPEGADADDDTLVAELAERKAAIEATLLERTDALATFAARARGRRFHVATGATAAPVPVSADACQAIPEECGEATLVPGTPYVAVVVANDRGDLFHRTRQLYHPGTARFIDARRPAERSATPLPDGDDADTAIVVARGGAAYLGGGDLVRFDRGVVFSGNRACGWSAPGARIVLGE